MSILLQRYWSPVYAFFRRLGANRDDAADLTQGFLTKILTSQTFLESADPERGRFRTFLKQSLRNHRIDELRREIGRTPHRRKVFVTDDPSVLESIDPAGDDDPFDAFSRQWAAVTLSTAATRLEKDCRAGGLVRHWEVFAARVLHPAMHGTDPESIGSLVERLELRDPDECSKLLFAAKRKFRVTLRDVVEETLADVGDVDDELQIIHQLLG